jgi:hypothetical protein
MKGWLLTCSILALALPAAALDDLTGTYQGKLTCDSTNATENFRSSMDTAFYVDDANDGSAFVYINNTLIVFRVAIAEPSETPDTGRFGGPSCGFTFAAGGSLLHGAVRSKEGEDKASLRGVFVLNPLGGPALTSCSYSVRRTSRSIPDPITACPP